MKNKKGFTLVELMAVIVVLGIVLSITTISVINLKEKQDLENVKNTVSSILTAAKEYNVDNRISINSTVSVSTLKDNGYVDYDETTKYKGTAYSSILGVDVTKKSCGGDSLKVKYVLNVNLDGTTHGYNDCGCELNDSVNTNIQSKKLCDE